MKYQFDQEFFKTCFQEIVNTPSPVGYYREAIPLLKSYADKFGYSISFDNRSTAYITLEGEDNSKTVMVGAHMDTLGLIVRRIDENGIIRVRQLGGLNYHSIEGETVTIHTRDGRSYTGLVTCQSHSVHVFDDARTLSRDDDTMMVLLDEKVHCKKDVTDLGIQNGDVISIAPRCQFTQSGFMKSRFIDDKGSVACFITMLKYLKDNDLRPKYRTIIALPFMEEIGLGGTYVPAEVSEFISVDIGLVGPDLDGNEYAVSICSKDNGTVYDYDLTSRLIDIAKRLELNYAVDIYYHYSTDAAASLKAGNNLKAATFGIAVYCSHGMERTHMDGVANTMNLLLGYVLGA